MNRTSDARLEENHDAWSLNEQQKWSFEAETDASMGIFCNLIHTKNV